MQPCAIGTMTRKHNDFPTFIGPALGYGATLLERAPKCDRKVIDISGDGISNYGYGPAAAFRNFMFDNVTVNGLVILSNSTGVVDYYRQNVLYGRNAFLIVAGGFSEFREAMTRKLYREINDIVLGSAPHGANGKT
ncbi:identified by similarity to GB:BAB50411.1 [hydrothermal vent metagenome]|uniref:Identified by similarity to GB:BAB50411.1 n=1 Tax=hydrothermal vent metagenome TaxID=652676 RepID=A0A3B0SSH1_9ZZZZ